MKAYESYLRGKRVTVLGLGLLGKLLGDIQFLSQMGAHVTVTDLKSKEDLAPSVKKLKGYKNITFVLGKHQLSDFEDKDFILKGQGTPLDSIYVRHARDKGIPIEMDETLFLKLAPPLHVIGITGTRGKTYTTELIYHIMKLAQIRVHLGGNIKGTSALALLPKVKEGDYVVFELSSWQLQGFGEAGISPEIAVFTSFMPDHMNYYQGDVDRYFKDKAYIFSNQKKSDVLVVRPGVKKLVYGKTNGRLVVAKSNDIPKSWNIQTPGEHIRENTSAAVAVCRELKIKESIIKRGVESFKGVPGRLELVRTIRGVKIYNDTTATTPEGAIAGLTALAPHARGKRVILIAGGADKMLNPKPFAMAITKYTKHIFLLAGTGTEKLLSFLKKAPTPHNDVRVLVSRALSVAQKGDIILFSPGFASFGLFKHEYDRGEQFNRAVKSAK